MNQPTDTIDTTQDVSVCHGRDFVSATNESRYDTPKLSVMEQRFGGCAGLSFHILRFHSRLITFLVLAAMTTTQKIFLL